MIVWRISNYLDLSGQGGLRAAARWHNAGRAIIYTASSPASALLEIMVHLELSALENLPDSFQLLQIEIPDHLARTTVSEANLPPNWRDTLQCSRSVGDDWLRQGKTALLSVPSAIVPHTENFLINPAQRDSADISIQAHGNFPLDFRLFK